MSGRRLVSVGGSCPARTARRGCRRCAAGRSGRRMQVASPSRLLAILEARSRDGRARLLPAAGAAAGLLAERRAVRDPPATRAEPFLEVSRRTPAQRVRRTVLRTWVPLVVHSPVQVFHPLGCLVASWGNGTRLLGTGGWVALSTGPPMISRRVASILWSGAVTPPPPAPNAVTVACGCDRSALVSTNRSLRFRQLPPAD